MSEFSIEFDQRQIRKLERGLGRLSSRIPGAIARAVNETTKGIRTTSSKMIRDRFEMKKGTVDRTIQKTRATRQAPRARVTFVKTRRLNLGSFKGTRQTKKGVSYRIEKQGGITHVPGAFKHERLVYKRRGAERLPLVSLRGISPWGAVVQTDLEKKIKIDARQRFKKNVRRNVRFELLRAAGRVSGGRSDR